MRRSWESGNPEKGASKRVNGSTFSVRKVQERKKEKIARSCSMGMRSRRRRSRRENHGIPSASYKWYKQSSHVSLNDMGDYIYIYLSKLTALDSVPSPEGVIVYTPPNLRLSSPTIGVVPQDATAPNWNSITPIRNSVVKTIPTQNLPFHAFMDSMHHGSSTAYSQNLGDDCIKLTVFIRTSLFCVEFQSRHTSLWDWL